MVLLWNHTLKAFQQSSQIKIHFCFHTKSNQGKKNIQQKTTLSKDTVKYPKKNVIISLTIYELTGI